jgi:PKD repeat protein
MEDAQMAEEAPKKSGKFGGWLKGGLTTLLGLLSGGVIAHFSPLLDKAIAPPKPVANFQCEADGLKVVFQNRSSGGQDGWWDFGDGTALVPFVADQPTVTHTYAKAGSYTVKLALRNFVNEENDRTANVTLDGAAAAAPVIDTFEVVPIHSDSFAPATFRLVSSVKNAELCVWSLGNQPIEFSPDTAKGSQERFVTFKDPGQYQVKLAAYNGKQPVEVSKTVEVKKPPLGTVMASVEVIYNAVKVETRTASPLWHVDFPADNKSASFVYARDIFVVNEGFEFIQANFVQPVIPDFVKNPQLKISADKRTLRLNCELVKLQPNAPAPKWNAQLQITQQKRSAPAPLAMPPIAVNLTVPGSTMIPLPPLPKDWVATSHKLALTLMQDGKQIAWKDGQLPTSAGVQMSSSIFVVSATEQANQLRIDLSQVWNPLNMVGN